MKCWLTLWMFLQSSLLTANGIIIAARQGNLSRVKQAVGMMPDGINTADSDGRTALHYAALLGKVDIVEYLISNEAHGNHKDVENKVAFQLAIEPKMTIERAKVASLLLHNLKGVHGRDQKGWTALHWAILAKDRRLIDRWLDDGATLLRYGPMIQRQHPIEVAFLTRDAKLIDYLIDRYEEWKGSKALWDAVNADIYDLVAALLKRDSDLANLQSPFSNSSLTRSAVNKGNADTLELLLANGMPVDDQYPLIEAARHNKHALVKLLIDYGTEIKVSYLHDWFNLVRSGLHSGDDELLKKIIAAIVADGSHMEIIPAFARVVPMKGAGDFAGVIDALLEAGVDINARDANDYTPLYHAIREKSAHAVHTLISSGADVEMRIANKTPLMLAATVGDVDVIKELLNNGADVHATADEEGNHDALYFAKRALEFEQKKEKNPHTSIMIRRYEKIVEMLKRQR